MKKTNKWIGWSLRLIGVALFVWLLGRVDLKNILLQILHAKWSYVLLSLFLGLPFIWLKSQRWRQLLKVAGTDISEKKAVQLYLMGLLSGLVTPGQTGDISKSIIVKAEGGTIKFGVASSLGDRVIDFIPLIGIICYMLIRNKGNAANLPDISGSGISIIVVCLSLIVTAAVLFSLRKMFGSNKTIEFSKFSGKKYFTPLIDCTVFSIVSFAIYIFRLYLLLSSLGVWLHLGTFIGLMSVVTIASVLPVSFAGIGLRDVTLITLLKQFDIGSSVAIAFSSLILSLFIFNGVLGLAGWFMYAGRLKSASADI